MKRTTKILALALSLLMLFTPILAGCSTEGTEPATTTEQGTIDETEAPSTPDDPSGNTKTTYTVEIETIGGMKMSDVSVYIYADDSLDDLDGYSATDAEGKVTFSLAKSDKYRIVLSDIPDGYDVKESYPFEGNNAKIVLTSHVIEESNPNASYKLGDVMYDFTVNTMDGKAFKLSEVLKEKDAVVINFWYTTCSWCATEFPYMDSAYQKYKDDIEIVAVNPYTNDTNEAIRLFMSEYGLSFPVAKDTANLANSFGVTSYPTSVFIDRYGVICMIEPGAIVSEKPFLYIFDHFTGDDYKQKLIHTSEDLIPVITPTEKMPASEEIEKVLNAEGVSATYRPEEDPATAELTWAFLLGEKNGEKCIYASNKEVDASYAIIYADVTMKKGEVLALDYFSSCELSADYLYILVDGKDIFQISGEGTDWETCYPFVALEDGTYEVALCYLKDESDGKGDDTVYIKGLRIVTEAEINKATYIPRFCATDMASDGTGYKNYVEIVFNAQDGYYHVGTENGPLLLVDLMKATQFSGNSIYEMAYNGQIVLNNVNYYDDLLPYFSYASNASLNGICTVNQELMELLKIVAEATGLEAGNDKQWLQMCLYYNAYGTNGEELSDPIRGLCNESAFIATEGKENPNYVTYNRVIMPRGLKYKFVPTKSGAYRVTSDSQADVDGWIFLEDGSQLCVYEGGERMYTDQKNCSMVVYMEEGQNYYINIAYYDVYQVGTFSFTVEYLAPTFELFTLASPGYFTFYENEGVEDMNDIVAGGIDVVLGTDGFYYEKRADGSLGSKIYADFSTPTPISTKTIQEMIDLGGFNFTLSENDHYIVDVINKQGKENCKEYLKQLWGDTYDLNMEIYGVDDVLAGKYHGKGSDMTEVARQYLSKMITASDTTAVEMIGCVEVDETLASILWSLMDKYTFEGVENSWLKVCYYYRYYGPATTNA